MRLFMRTSVAEATGVRKHRFWDSDPSFVLGKKDPFWALDSLSGFWS